MSRSASTALVALVATFAVGVVSVAAGAIPGGDGTINACYASNGEVRVIDKEAGKTCNKGWTPLSWNQTGPQGEQGHEGAPGATGPRGPSNVYGTFADYIENLPDTTQVYNLTPDGEIQLHLAKDTVMALSLPAGSFHIQAKAFSTGNSNVGCVLVAGSDYDASFAFEKQGNLMMQVLHTFSSPGIADLRCTDYGTFNHLAFVKIHATQVESISNPPAP